MRSERTAACATSGSGRKSPIAGHGHSASRKQSESVTQQQITNAARIPSFILTKLRRP